MKKVLFLLLLHYLFSQVFLVLPVNIVPTVSSKLFCPSSQKTISSNNAIIVEDDPQFLVYLVYDSKNMNEVTEINFREFQKATTIYADTAEVIDRTAFYGIDVAKDPNLLVEMEISELPCYRIRYPSGKLISLALRGVREAGRILAENLKKRYDEFFTLDFSYEMYVSKSQRIDNPFFIKDLVKANKLMVIYIGEHQQDFIHFSEYAEYYPEIKFAHCSTSDCFSFFEQKTVKKGDIIISEYNKRSNLITTNIIRQGHNRLDMYDLLQRMLPPTINFFNEYWSNKIFVKNTTVMLVFFKEWYHHFYYEDLIYQVTTKMEAKKVS